VTNDSTISGSALRLHDLIQSSVALRSMVARHPDLLSALIKAATIADERGKSDSLIEVVARAACTNDRVVEATCSGNDIELSERILLADRANEALGDILRELVPEALPIGGDASSVAPAN
jgi:hypothetical protein